MTETGCLKDGHFQNSETENMNVSGLGTGRLRLGNTTLAAGLGFTSKIDTGILNAPTIFTTPVPATDISTGAISLVASMFADGIIIGTATGTTDAVTMPAKSVFVTLFGTDAKVGDSFRWYLHNAAINVQNILILTVSTDGDGIVPTIQAAAVAANSPNNASSKWGGTSTGQFMTQLTNVNGSTKTYRLS